MFEAMAQVLCWI